MPSTVLTVNRGFLLTAGLSLPAAVCSGTFHGRRIPWMLNFPGYNDGDNWAGIRLLPMPEHRHIYERNPWWDGRDGGRGLRSWVDRNGQIHDPWNVVVRGHLLLVTCGERDCNLDLTPMLRVRTEEMPCPGR